MHDHTSEILDSEHYRIIAITAICAGVVFFDFSLFIYLADVFSSVFFDGTLNTWLGVLQIFALFATGYLARPIGGLLIGKYGDTYGRKPAFTVSILITMIFTLIIAFLPTYQQVGIIAPLLLIVARFGQGLAIGGSLPAAWTFIVEHLPNRSLGFGCGVVCAACIASFLLAMTTMSFLQNNFTYEQMYQYGWRILFVMGALMSLCCLWLLKKTRETPIFMDIANHNTALDSYIDSVNLEEQNHPTPDYAPPAAVSFRPKGLRAILVSIIKHHTFALLMASLISLIVSSLSLFIPILLVPLLANNFQISTDELYFGTMIGLVFLMLGSVLFGYLVDRLDAGRVMVSGGLFLIILVAVSFYHLQNGGDFILLCFAFLGLGNGLLGALPSVMTRLFPAKVRMTGLGLSYNTVTALVGGVLPFALGYASFYFSFAPAIYLALIGILAVFISFFVYYMPRSTRDLNR